MDEKRDHPRKSIAFQDAENTKKFRMSGTFSAFMDYFHAVNTMSLIMGCSQIILGTGILTIAFLGLIRPVWLSTLFSVVASMAAAIGIYFCYTTFPAWRSDTLLREAMRRIVEEQN